MIIDLLRKRVSVRKFQNKLVPDDVLQEILEAGRLSPSGGNEQPWVFGVITDPALIAQIAEAARGQKWIAKAPLLIALCATIVADERGGRDIQTHRYPEYADIIIKMDKDIYSALNQEEHQTKIAGAHMALFALERGVGSCWVSRFDVRQVAELLHLPEGIIPAEILVFGYPEKERKPTPKKPLEEVVFYNTFEQ
ncbi:MAG: nitroreductase family protein [Anaerolineae bacterium]|jgi:nitroreductase|nr:nitroreductase family protein [Anaerolineae bacterium]